MAPALDMSNVDAETAQAVDAVFRDLMSADLPGIDRIILFGSRARGDNGPDSDADVAVVFKGSDYDQTIKLIYKVVDVAFESLAKYKFLVSLKVLWSDYLTNPIDAPIPSFYRNVLNDGIVWDDHNADG